jgi:hypothetical protein
LMAINAGSVIGDTIAPVTTIPDVPRRVCRL